MSSRSELMGVLPFCVSSGGGFRETVGGPCCWSVPTAIRPAVTSTDGNGIVLRESPRRFPSLGRRLCAVTPFWARGHVCAGGILFATPEQIVQQSFPPCFHSRKSARPVKPSKNVTLALA